MADPTPITPKQILTPFPVIAAGAFDFTFAACTLTDGDDFVCSGAEPLLFYNPTGGALTATITSADDDKGRAEDITSYSIGAGEFAVFGVGLTNEKGWKGTANKIRITASSASLLVAVLRLPAGFGR